ncbi:hypothetical protein EAI_11677 [Harpegnathos saltator]|uniref:Uncharacterized protein n=1 Tax=Harpegnathos saltator TaxID=610380 RepID=E2BYX8_HARSA|nr:hypothetical protein EAI_11677 [Harpegnathos saltator]
MPEIPVSSDAPASAILTEQSCDRLGTSEARFEGSKEEDKVEEKWWVEEEISAVRIEDPSMGRYRGACLVA